MATDPAPTMTMGALERTLREAMAADLPGARAQAQMAPRPRPGWRPGQVPGGTRDAAGLLLLYPRDRRPHLVLTVRGALLHHSGQVSLPGGATEPGETVAQAAVREAAEEVGVDATRVRIIGALTPLHIPVSGFTLHPVLAITDERPMFLEASDEVARVLEVPVETLLNGTCLHRATRIRDGVEFDMPYFEIDGEVVWGATAMVLAEFLWLLGAEPDPWRLGSGSQP